MFQKLKPDAPIPAHIVSEALNDFAVWTFFGSFLCKINERSLREKEKEREREREREREKSDLFLIDAVTRMLNVERRVLVQHLTVWETDGSDLLIEIVR